MKENFKIAVLCQDDVFVIPRNIKILSNLQNIDIVSIVNINSAGSLTNKKIFFLKGFGFYQFFKMGLLSIFYKLIDAIDSLSLYKLKFYRSLNSSAASCNALYKQIDNPNDPIFLKWLKNQKLDLVVSYSAPCVFEKELLEIPKYGCINLHCSLLPSYAGLLPSFWTLYEKSKTIGATVHLMDSKIDNGKILSQIKVNLPLNPSMFSVINATKAEGGKLMASVVESIKSNSELPENLINEKLTPSYYSWPTIEQLKDFRSKGGRLI